MKNSIFIKNMIHFLTNLFDWITNHTEQDKLLHKDCGEIIFFLTCVALFLCGINSWLSLGLSLAVVAFIGFFKEYIFDSIAIENDKPDVKDALWTLLGGIEAFIAMSTVYLLIK